jgi:hypothetical protein
MDKYKNTRTGIYRCVRLQARASCVNVNAALCILDLVWKHLQNSQNFCEQNPCMDANIRAWMRTYVVLCEHTGFIAVAKREPDAYRHIVPKPSILNLQPMHIGTLFLCVPTLVSCRKVGKYGRKEPACSSAPSPAVAVSADTGLSAGPEDRGTWGGKEGGAFWEERTWEVELQDADERSRETQRTRLECGF